MISIFALKIKIEQSIIYFSRSILWNKLFNLANVKLSTCRSVIEIIYSKSKMTSEIPETPSQRFWSTFKLN